MNNFFVDISQSVERAVLNFSIDWEFKAGTMLLLFLLEKHLTIFTAFATVVFIDLFAKFIALSYQRLKGMGVNPTILESIRGIPAAHRDGIINSSAMKTQFLGKIIMYLIVVISAGIGDLAIREAGGHSEFYVLAIGYLVGTELLSIVENLDQAGVSAMHDLVTLIKMRRNH